MNVEDNKHQARSLEQEGETEAALELYEKILAELEGTPEIWRELPLYVKAGDLSLKLNDSSNAISHYEKAANAYAAYGSSKSVIALCIKILRVNPGRTHVFLRLVRLMIEREHLADARLVLLEYAERLKLPKAGLVLESLADAPEDQMKPTLEMLLELGGRYEYARAQGRDLAAEDEAGEEEHGSVEDASQPESDSEATISLAAAEQIERDSEDHTEAEETTADPSVSEPATETEDGGDAAQTGDSPTAPSEGDVQWVDERPSMRASTPRASRQVLFREADQAKKKPIALWVGLGAAAVVVVGGLSLVLFDVIPLGGSDTASEGGLQPIPVAPADSALMAGADLEDSTGTAEDSVDVTSADSAVGAAEPAAPRQQPPVETVDTGTTAAATESLPSETDAAGDTLANTEGADSTDAPVEPPAPELPPGRGVMVQDFDIESNTEFFVDGRVGYRTVQILGTGEQLTISAVYYGDDISNAPGTEEMTLAPLAGDTTTAIMHFNGYAIEARALVSASILGTMLGRLVEVPRSN